MLLSVIFSLFDPPALFPLGFFSGQTHWLGCLIFPDTLLEGLRIQVIAIEEETILITKKQGYQREKESKEFLSEKTHVHENTNSSIFFSFYKKLKMNIGDSPSIENIMKVGFGFMPAKILLTAVELDIFTIIARTKSAKAVQIKKQLNLLCNDRHVYDFLDALVGLGFLEREGVLEAALYSNSRDTDHFLNKNKPTYLGGGLELGNIRMYKMWGSLDQALRTGARQNDAENDQDMFDQNYKSPEKLRKFVNGMGDLQAVGFRALASKFDFSKYQKMIDIGGSGAKLSLSIAQKHSHLSCSSLDLPPVEAIARTNITNSGLQSQVSTGIIDFFKEDFPKTDVITMGNILHDWGQNEKDHLLKSSFKALNEGGAFIAIENVIDDDRRKNVYGLQMSLNMLLETNGGFDYTFKEFTEWALRAGFKRTELIHLVGPKSAAVAYK